MEPIEIRMLKKLTAILGDERGVSALEYAVIAALVAVVVIGSVSLNGTDVSKLFSRVASTIEARPFCHAEAAADADCAGTARRLRLKGDASFARPPCPEGGRCS